MLASKSGFSGVALAILLVGFSAVQAQDDDEVISYAVRAVTSKGAEFSGLVPRTQAFDDLLNGTDSIDPASADKSQRLKLAAVNGMNGSATFYFGGLRSIQVEGRLTEEDLKQRRESQAASRKGRLEREQVRLQQVTGRRDAARQAEEREQQEQQQQGSEQVLSKDHQEWIDRFPPDEGWIPAKRSQLYYQTVILNNRPPTDDERAWLDGFDQWKLAYDAWLVLEKQKLQEEEAAKQAAKQAAEQGDKSVEPPTGNDRSDLSGTSASEGAEIDPSAPTPEEQQRLLPALDPETPKPDKISEAAPKPVPLKPYAVKPEPLKDGSRP